MALSNEAPWLRKVKNEPVAECPRIDKFSPLAEHPLDQKTPSQKRPGKNSGGWLFSRGSAG